MSQQVFYFINYTRKEFIFFTNKISIITAISDAIANSAGWTDKDDIRIGSEGHHDTSCLEYLDELRYTMSKVPVTV